MKNRLLKFVSVLLAVLILMTFSGCLRDTSAGMTDEPGQSSNEAVSADEIPDFSGDAYVVINDNIPAFDFENLPDKSFENYGDLDFLGRCSAAYANIGRDLMPTEERGSIGQVKPSGWVMAKYDFVDGKYLYNRCHLIGFQLTGENANEENLITGTRYLNVEGMLPFENMVADYIKETDNHVLYRVTPIFERDNLVASGVQMEAYSVEDGGEGICFNVYCYNVQPGVSIDYSSGESQLAEGESAKGDENDEDSFVINTNNRKFHYADCSSVGDMKESNKQEYTGSRQTLIDQGYSPCGNCKPDIPR